MTDKPPPTITLTLEQTRQNLDHDESLVREMAEIFIADVPPLCRQLQQCLTAQLTAGLAHDSPRDPVHDPAQDSPSGDAAPPADAAAEQCRSLAHAIRGLAAMFGAQPLTDCMQAIENRPSNCPRDQLDELPPIARLGQATADALAAELTNSDRVP